jgi:CBS domain-containing protein
MLGKQSLGGLEMRLGWGEGGQPVNETGAGRGLSFCRHNRSVVVPWEAEEIEKWKELRVRSIMTLDVTTLKRNDKLTLADDIMQLGRIRHLPVLDEEGQQLVGLVTQRDLFRGALARALGYGQHAQRKVFDTLLVKEVMSSEVITTTPDTPLVEAARVLLERKIGCLPVLEGGPLVGIVTESDFVAMVARKGQ